MSCFDDIPEDRQESHPCECGGDITEDPPTFWVCNKCGVVNYEGLTFIKVTKKQFYETINPTNASLPVLCAYPYKTVFKTLDHTVKGLSSINSNGEDTYYLEEGLLK